MLVSLKWIRDYVDIDLPSRELVDRLTMAGLEVEGLEEKKPAFTGIVVAKILSIKPHPHADKLSFCEVTTGDRTLPIVCGAKNIKTGDMVPLATVGATIPGGYTIKSSKIRGVASEGMLCSEEELGIGTDHTGIMILPDPLFLGQDLAVALDLTDTVLDINITPNRSDCLSMIGIAREIAALTGKKLRYPDIQISETAEDIQTVTSVDILDPDLCPRYTARVIKNVRIMPSPFWMRQRLEAIGLRSINNAVDITNYVMMEFGQPLHAFDHRFLEEGRIVVRGAQENEPFVSLDGKERLLKAGTLMICDGVKPVAIAGIMGGLNSEVTNDTETILLESAYFSPSSIRRSARWLGMGTDAAFRFERGIDPGGVVQALNRAAQLMASLSGGSVCKGFIDQYPNKIVPVQDIPLRTRRVNDLLGTDVADEDMIRILKSLEMTVKRKADGQYLVSPPSFRVDMEREIDLVEEVARIYGYDRIPVAMPAIPAVTAPRDSRQVLAEKISQILTGYGYSEVINYSFTTPAAVNLLALKEDDQRRRLVKIRNPLTEDQAVLRTTIVFSLLETMRKNAHAGSFDLKLFELGKVFIHLQQGDLPHENNRLGVLLTGLRYDGTWHASQLPADFYDLKGCLEGLFDALKITAWTCRSESSQPFLHPGRSFDIALKDHVMGFLGEIHPRVLAALDLKNQSFILELDLDALAGEISWGVQFRDIPRFPASSRDVAFLIPSDLEGAALLQLALGRSEELLERIYIFDVYTGESIPPGTKSLGLRFSYRSAERTMTDEEVNQVHNRIVGHIVAKSGAKIRGEGN